jgi:hypothetical protein
MRSGSFRTWHWVKVDFMNMLIEDAALETTSVACGAEEIHAQARLLEYKQGSYVAFAPHVTVGLVHQPQLISVPGAPNYALGLIPWDGRYIPLIDLASLLHTFPQGKIPAVDHVLVLAFQRAPGEPLEHGAVCAPYLVKTVEVTDSRQRALPDDSHLWPLTAISCFEFQGAAVPVLDTALVFGQTYL